MECAYCAAIMLICLHVFFYFRDRGFRTSFPIFFIDGICVVPLAPATSTMSGDTFQPFCYDVIYEWLVFYDLFV